MSIRQTNSPPAAAGGLFFLLLTSFPKHWKCGFGRRCSNNVLICNHYKFYLRLNKFFFNGVINIHIVSIHVISPFMTQPLGDSE